MSIEQTEALSTAPPDPPTEATAEDSSDTSPALPSAPTSTPPLTAGALVKAIARHCIEGDISFTIDSVIETTGANKLAFLRAMHRVLGNASGVDCTKLVLDLQVAYTDTGSYPPDVQLSTHPTTPGAHNLEDCPSLHWPVAIPDDLVGAGLDNAFLELLCFNISDRAPDGHDPLDVPGDTGSGWVVVRVNPSPGTRVSKTRPVTLYVRRR